MTKRANYIAFEGVDGSGKTKQLFLLKEALEQAGYTVLSTSEFGSKYDSVCQKIRALTLNDCYDLDEVTQQALIASCSFQHSEKVIKPSLSKYDFILSDRSIESNVAYAYAAGFNEAFVNNLFFLDKRRVYPNKIVYLKVDPEISWNRIESRKKEKFENNGNDRIESKGIEHQYKIKNWYDRQVKRNDYVVINSQESVKKTHNLILENLFPEGIQKI